MPKVLSLVGAKGGTLKTSSVTAIAHLAAKGGLYVVMVDADPQADLTSRSGFSRVAEPLAADPVAVTFGSDHGLPRQLLRGGRSMEGADLSSALRQIERARALGPDLVVVDTPPALGPITTAAVRGSDLVLIPAVPGKESLERINDIAALARGAATAVQLRVLLTLVHRRSNLLAWMQEEVDRHYPGLRMDRTFPFEMAAGEAALYEKPVTLYAPRSSNAAEFCDLVREVLGILGLARVGLRPAAGGL
ncbi:MAG TPA: ParA family protein [Longimicrobium sp.]|jgi:chromosome partitioning protein